MIPAGLELDGAAVAPAHEADVTVMRNGKRPVVVPGSRVYVHACRKIGPLRHVNVSHDDGVDVSISKPFLGKIPQFVHCDDTRTRRAEPAIEPSRKPHAKVTRQKRLVHKNRNGMSQQGAEHLVWRPQTRAPVAVA